MAVFSLAPRRLVATVALSSLLVAVGSTAATAGPASPTSPASSAAATKATTPRKPDATAPPAPTDYGPPCTTNATAQNPVVCLPAGSGEDEAAPLTPGDYVEFDAQVVNNGPAVADASVVITLPKGLELESDEDDPVSRVDDWFGDDDGDYTALTCQDGVTATTCSVGKLAAHANILVAVDLQVAKDAAPGTTLSFQVALAPVGTPTYPATSVTARIDVLEPSHLEVSLTPATLRTVVGHSATMTGIVHNLGPGTAPSTVAVAVDLDEDHPDRTHFTITSGTGTNVGGGSVGGGSDSAGSSSSAAAVPFGGRATVVVIGAASSGLHTRLQRQALRHHAVSAHRRALPSLRYWPLGTLAAGATTRVPITLKALTVGTDTLTFGALSASTQADCLEQGGSGSGTDSGVPSASGLVRAPQAVSTTSAPAGCPFALETRITAVPEPAATAPLANTGSRTDVELGIALWALVLGSLLVWAGRRRRISVRRHG